MSEQESTATQPTVAPDVAVVSQPPRGTRLPWVLTASATVAAVAFAAMWAPLYLQNQDRERVRAAAEELVLHLTTFEGETIDEWVQATQRMATEAYAEEVNTLFDPELRAALRDAQAKSVGRLVNLFVQDVDGDDALVFVVVRQTITNAQTAEPVEDELRMQIELVQDGGTWKAAKVEVLGPQGGGGELVDEAPAPGGSAGGAPAGGEGGE